MIHQHWSNGGCIFNCPMILAAKVQVYLETLPQSHPYPIYINSALHELTFTRLSLFDTDDIFIEV